MKTHVPIILRRTGHYLFPGQEKASVYRANGQIIGDVKTETAAYLIANSIADLYIGEIPSYAEFLNPNHPQSNINVAARRRQAEYDLIIRCGIAASQSNQ